MVDDNLLFWRAGALYRQALWDRYEFPVNFAAELIVNIEFNKNELRSDYWFVYEDQL